MLSLFIPALAHIAFFLIIGRAFISVKINGANGGDTFFKKKLRFVEFWCKINLGTLGSGETYNGLR